MIYFRITRWFTIYEIQDNDRAGEECSYRLLYDATFSKINMFLFMGIEIPS